MAIPSSPLEKLNANTATLIYSELSAGQIRLITLLPGNHSDPIKCNLSVVSHLTSAKGTYEALSYVWGSQENLTTMTLKNHPMYITRNLEAALIGLRLPSSPCMLWIDALCINQTSIPERNAQVRIMHEIYGNAACVLIWLGSAPGASEVAMRFIQETTMGGFPDLVDGMDDEGLISVSDAMRSLFLKEYWQRLWIVQEVAQAKQAVLLCGEYEIGWETLMMGISMSFSAIWTTRLSAALAVKGKEADMGFLDGFFHDRGPQSVVPPTKKKSEYEAEDEKKKILKLATMTAEKKCVDPRDKIFGIYNLAFIDGGGCLDIITWPTRPQSTSSNPEDELNLPSWVPNWSVPLDVIPYAVWHDQWGPNPDPRTTFVSYQFDTHNILNIKSCIVGRISSTLVSQLLQTRVDSPSTEAELNELWLYFIRCWKMAQIEETDAKIDKFLDCVSVQYKLEPKYFRPWVTSFRKNGQFPRSSEFKLPLEALTWLGRGRQVQTYRMFMTFDWLLDPVSTGIVGSGFTSTSAKEGDLVCVLPGCLLPVVLRAVEGNRHVIVSDAYTVEHLTKRVLFGIKDGSVLQENLYIC